MPTWRKTITLGAGASNASILQGSIYEFPSAPTRVVVAAAANVGTTAIGINFGSRTIAPQSDNVVPLEPAAGVGPNIPDQVIADDVAMPGERIVISLADAGAGSTNRVLVNFVS